MSWAFATAEASEEVNIDCGTKKFLEIIEACFPLFLNPGFAIIGVSRLSDTEKLVANLTPFKEVTLNGLFGSL